MKASKSGLRDVEEMLAQRGIDVIYETIRCWVDKFGRKSPRTSGATTAAFPS